MPAASDPVSPGDDSLPREGLRDAAVAGVRWVVVARVCSEVLGLAASVVLAHLVAPAEFGSAVVAMVLPMLSVILTFEGFGTVLVQRDRLERAQAQTAAWLSFAAGLFLAVAIWATAPLWAEPLFGSRTAELVRLAAPVFPIAGIAVVPRAYLQRRLDFRRLSTYEVVAFTVGSVVSVGCAAAGLDAEALILGMLAMTATEAGLLVAAAPPPRPRLVPGCAREIVAFGLPASLAGLAYVARRNVDYVILAATLPAALVGFYWRAFQLGAEYQSKLSGVIFRLAFPLFSRARDTADLRLLRSRVVRTNVNLVFPLLAAFVVVAPILIPWLYGARWEPVVEPAQILAISGMALAVLSGTEPLMLAVGRPRALLGFNGAFLAATAAAAFVAAPHGLSAVALAVSGVHVAMVALAQILLVGRVVGISVPDLVRDVAPAAVASAGSLAAGIGAAPWIEGAGAPLAEVTALTAICLVTYAALLRALFESTWDELARTVRRVIGRTAGRRHPVVPSQSGARS
ncbi:MAG TPA: oligosaccharide flippase family protein [Solirubrobacterales bacterium]|jgi:O-antigen/teichoic acid export membrane protein|nr:oligosaccharide flippase family protein [Solirubrobacterales bacterium]